MRFALLPILVLLPCLARAADSPATTAAAETRYASREIRIEGDHQEQQRLITAAAEKLAQRAGLTPQQLDSALHTQPIIHQHGVQWPLTLILPEGTKPAARELLDELVATVRESTLQAARDAKAKELAELRLGLDAAEKQLAAAQEKARKRREELHKVADRADVSAAGIQSAISSLEQERQRLELDELGKTARREALEDQIAQQTERAAQKIEQDPVSAELRKVVALREEQLKRFERMHETGQVARTELDEAMARTAETRARLLERQHEAAAEAGADILQAFTRELLTLSVDLRELNARLEFVKQRLDRLRQATDLLDGLSQAEAEVSIMRNETGNLRTSVRSVEQRQPPKFEILSSDDREAPPGNAPGSHF